MELQTGMVSILVECFPVTSLRHQYDITFITITYYDIIGIEAWQTVYSMLRQIFIDITI